jgi:hypothetical protein
VDVTSIFIIIKQRAQQAAWRRPDTACCLAIASR